MLNIDLNTILSKNQKVMTQSIFDNTLIENTVLEINNGLIQLLFKEEYLKLLLTIGDALKIVVSRDNTSYILIGVIENVSVGIPNKLCLMVQSCITHDNIRKYQRQSINLLCKLLPENDEFKIQGITTDISEGGISLVAYADFNSSAFVSVEIYQLNNEVICFKGTIKRLAAKLNDHIQYGVEITEIDEKNKILFSKLIKNTNRK